MTGHLRFLLDEHIPATVARGLQLRGVDVLTIQEAGRTGYDDESQIEFARSQQRVIVTSDADFLALAASNMNHAGIVFAQAGRCSIGELVRRLLLVYSVLTPDDMTNHVEFL